MTTKVSSQMLKRPLTLFGEGYGSKVYITADNIILRVAKNKVTQRRHQQEIQLLSFITPFIRSMEIPRPIMLIEPTGEFPFGAIGYKRIEGVPLTPELITAQNRENIAGQIAMFIHEVHTIEPGLARFKVALPTFPPSKGELQVIWNTVEPHLRKVLRSEQFHGAGSWFESAVHTLSTPTFEPTLLHGDLWYENMIFKDDKVVGIIDFENFMIGHPIQDFITQEYISSDFKDLVILLYQKLDPSFTYDSKLADNLLGVREIEGLDYGLKTGEIDEEQIDKIVRALHL